MITLKRQQIKLSKHDKKVARTIIEKGLQIEFAKGLFFADSVLDEWKNNVRNNRESYHLLFKAAKEFDKHIAKRYDGMTGSKYIFVIAAQLIDGIIDEADLKDLSEDVQQTIINICR